MKESVKNIFEELFLRYPELEVCRDSILEAYNIIRATYENGGCLFACGNGGSCADCDHISGELMKGFLKMRPLSDGKKAEMRERFPAIDEKALSSLQYGLPAISLPSLTALNTAFSNDVDPELIYAQGVLALAVASDVLLAISTSGNSKSVTRAAEIARALGVTVIALTGKGGGWLAKIADVCICVPECETYKVQERHLPIYHALCAEIEKHFFK